MVDNQLFDVIVVGAGFAGLSAARYLSSRSIRCLVIEGRSRVGGRTLSEKTSDNAWTIDLGGQWVTQSQKRVLSLAEQFGLTLIEQTWYHPDPNHLGQAIGLPPLTDTEFRRVVEIDQRWDDMALELTSVDDAVSHKNSPQWAQMSVNEFIDEQTREDELRIRQELKLQILTLTACEPDRVSLLYWLTVLRSIPGGLSSLDDGCQGAQHFKLSTGSQHLCFLMSLQENVCLDDALQSVDYQSESRIVLTLVSGRQLTCRRLLLAFSPSLLSTITWSPPLPSHCSCHMIMGQCIKTIFLYSKPFWRDVQVNITQEQGPCSNIFESSSPTALIGLVVGGQAASWCQRDQTDLVEAIIKQYSSLYGTEDRPTHTYVQYWPKEEFSGGCYAGVYPPGSLSQWRHRQRALVDKRIWIASTEMAQQWIGYIEGAIEAGQRMAQHIARTL